MNDTTNGSPTHRALEIRALDYARAAALVDTVVDRATEIQSELHRHLGGAVDDPFAPNTTVADAVGSLRDDAVRAELAAVNGTTPGNDPAARQATHDVLKRLELIGAAAAEIVSAAAHAAYLITYTPQPAPTPPPAPGVALHLDLPPAAPARRETTERHGLDCGASA